jgi:hypothetical protein
MGRTHGGTGPVIKFRNFYHLHKLLLFAQNNADYFGNLAVTARAAAWPSSGRHPHG